MTIAEVYIAIFERQLWLSDNYTKEDCKLMLNPTGEAEKVVVFHIKTLSRKFKDTHIITYN